MTLTYVNGVRLTPADYTATNGTNVVLDVGANTGDIVDIIYYEAAGPAGAQGATGAQVLQVLESRQQVLKVPLVLQVLKVLLVLDIEKIEEGNSKVEVDDSGSGNITATVDGTEALRVDSSGRVLLGTTTAGDGSADNLTIADAGQGNDNPQRTSSVGGIYLGDATSGSDQYRGFFEYNHNGDFLRIGTASAEKLRIDDAGRLTITGQGLKLNTNNSSLYTLDGSLSYYATTNAVYLNGAGTGGWLRLNAAGTENNQNAINIFGGGAGAYIDMRTNNVERLRITSAGKIGIGTEGNFAPTAPLSIKVGSGGEYVQDFRGSSTKHLVSSTIKIIGTQQHSELMSLIIMALLLQDFQFIMVAILV